eukprot:scaffold59309_cov17-Tisochrysis_lutea.AAC.1
MGLQEGEWWEGAAQIRVCFLALAIARITRVGPRGHVSGQDDNHSEAPKILPREAGRKIEGCDGPREGCFVRAA